MTAIAIALATVLFGLAALHMRWAVRNRFESTFVIPRLDGRFVFIPSRSVTALVAIALGVAALLALAQGHVIAVDAPAPLRWAAYAAGATFTARAIGDFHLVGFFKRVKGTTFARWDNYLFSPLSAFVGLAFLYLAHY